MADQDGFTSRPNSGVRKADLERGYSRDLEDQDQGMIGYGDYLMSETDNNMPFFSGGFCGRALGWER